MTEKELVEAEIQAALTEETSALSLSEKLFSPGALFSRLASTEEERRVVVRSTLFHDAQARFRQLQFQEADLFAHVVSIVPEGYMVKIERIEG